MGISFIAMAALAWAAGAAEKPGIDAQLSCIEQNLDSGDRGVIGMMEYFDEEPVDERVMENFEWAGNKCSQQYRWADSKKSTAMAIAKEQMTAQFWRDRLIGNHMKMDIADAYIDRNIAGLNEEYKSLRLRKVFHENQLIELGAASSDFQYFSEFWEYLRYRRRLHELRAMFNGIK